MLTPQDIENKTFKREMRGYSVEEVEDFLREICDSYEELYKANTAAKERIAMLSDAVKQYKSMEDMLQNALKVAENSGEEIKQNAREKADVIIKDAETKAAKIIDDSAKEVTKVSYQYEQVKRSVEVFRAKVVSLLNTQLDILKEYSAIVSDTDAQLEEQTENTADITDRIVVIPDEERKG